MSRNIPWRTARPMFALNRGRNDWYRIRNQLDGPTQLHIYDEIGYFGVSASDLIRDLADVNGPLEVHINSPGGEVFDGVAIYNALMARRDVTIVIDGIAASIASVIAMAGNPVLIARQAQMMVHDGFAMAIGNAQDLRDLAEHLDRTSNNIAQIYSEHTGRPVTYWREIMKAETWYGAQEALDSGLADRFVDSGAGRAVTPPSDSWDMGVFRARQRQQPPEPDPAPAGSVIMSVMGPDGEVYNWDAGSALAKCSSASDYRSVCAGEKEVGEPDQAQHWALPHHASPGAGPDKGGVVAAMGRWNQTEGLKNKDAALSHLKAHASELGLPSGDGGGKNKADNDLWSELTDDQILNALKGA